MFKHVIEAGIDENIDYKLGAVKKILCVYGNMKVDLVLTLALLFVHGLVSCHFLYAEAKS